MAISVVMPALEMAQDTGQLLAWRKKEGDRVIKGEPLAEIETDKAVVEIESPGDGILAAISAREGDVVPVGRTIAWLVSPGESPPAEGATEQSHRTAPALTNGTTDVAGRDSRHAAVRSAGLEACTGAAGPGSRISPKARRLAAEHGIDLSTVVGSGPAGEILTEDVQAAIANRR